MALSYKPNLAKDESNVSWVFADRLMITFSGDGTVTDARLDELVRDALAHKIEFVLGTGIGRGTMSSTQRKKSAEVFRGLTRIATVYDDRLTRGIVTALGWLGLNIRSFDWSDLQGALDYLNAPGLDKQEISRFVIRLRDDALAMEKPK